MTQGFMLTPSGVQGTDKTNENREPSSKLLGSFQDQVYKRLREVTVWTVAQGPLAHSECLNLASGCYLL